MRMTLSVHPLHPVVTPTQNGAKDVALLVAAVTSLMHAK